MSWPENQPKLSKHESAAAWKRIEEPFTRMYQVERLDLGSIRVTLARDYEFEASYDWFWTQIRRWKLQRKPRVRQRTPLDAPALPEEDAQPRSDDLHDGTGCSETNLQYIAEGQGDGPTQMANKRLSKRRTLKMFTGSPNVPRSIACDLETGLRYCESCLVWLSQRCGAFQHPQNFPPQSGPIVRYGTSPDYAFIDSFLNGIRVAEKSNKLAGWRHFELGCSLVQQCIRERPWTALIQFVEFYTEERWDQANDIRSFLTNFFAMEAEKVENSIPGDSRYLSTLFRFWINNNAVKDALLQVFQLMSKHCIASTSGDSRGRVFIQAELAWKFTDIESYAEAEATSNAILQSEGVPVDIMISAMRNLSAIRRSKGDRSGAISLVQEAIALCEEHPNGFLIPEESLRLTQNLGRLMLDCDRQTEAAQYLWSALDKAAQVFNSEASEAQVFYLELKSVLEKCGDVDGLSSLEAKHAWAKTMIERNSLWT